MFRISDYRKVLINQTAFIGDVVLTLPLAIKIKELNPNAEIHFLTTKVSAKIPKLINEIDEIIVFDKRGDDRGVAGIKKLIDKLENEQYDLIISPHRSSRSSIINFFAGARLSISFDKSALSFLYNKKVKYDRKRHEIERNLSLLSIFDEFDNYIYNKPNLNVDIESKNKIDSFIITNNLEKFVVIAPGSVWATKRWLPENFASLAKLLIDIGYKVILSGSKDDSIICSEIEKAVNDINLINSSGKFTINETIYLISKANFIITNDSAPIHFAGLTKTKTVAIFGPTIPEFGFAPVGTDDIIIQNNDLKCRPCAIHGGDKCPLGTLECMKGITPEMVMSKITKSL